MAVQIFADAVAQGAGIVAEQLTEHGDVVRYQRLLVARKLRGHFAEHLGEIDLHR